MPTEKQLADAARAAAKVEWEARAEQLPPLPENPKHVFLGHHIYTAEQMQAYARAALAANVPAGFVMVPVEPTPEMLHCAEMWDDGFPGAWSRALAAAPSPEAAELAKAHEARRHAQSEAAYLKARLAGARLILMRELKEQGWTPPAPAQAQQSTEPTDAELLALWAKHEKHWKFEQNVLRFSRALLEAKPEAQQPLTEEDILDIARYWSNKHFVEGAARFLIDFVRGIEEHHGIGASGEGKA